MSFDQQNEDFFQEIQNLIEQENEEFEQKRELDQKEEEVARDPTKCRVCRVPLQIDPETQSVICPVCGTVDVEASRMFGFDVNEPTQQELEERFTNRRKTKTHPAKPGRKPGSKNKKPKKPKPKPEKKRQGRGELKRRINEIKANFPNISEIQNIQVPALNRAGSSYSELNDILNRMQQIIESQIDEEEKKEAERVQRRIKYKKKLPKQKRQQRAKIRKRVLNMKERNPELLGNFYVKSLRESGSSLEYYENLYRQFSELVLQQEEKEIETGLSPIETEQSKAEAMRINELIRQNRQGSSIMVDFPNYDFALSVLAGINYPDNVNTYLQMILRVENQNGDISQLGITITDTFLGNVVDHLQSQGDYSDEYYEGFLEDLKYAVGAEFVILNKIEFRNEEEKEIRQDRPGNFFVYRHLLPDNLDLTRLQIFSESKRQEEIKERDKFMQEAEKEFYKSASRNDNSGIINYEKKKKIAEKKFSKNVDKSDKNCLLHCLEDAGFDDNYLMKASKYVQSGSINKSKLTKLANDLEIKIILHHPRRDQESKNKNRKIIYPLLPKGQKVNKDWPVLEVCLVANHYFPYCDIPIAKQGLKRYPEVKDKKEWWRIWRINKNGKIERAREGTPKSFTKSLEVVEYLMDHKDLLLKKIPPAELMKYEPKFYVTENLVPEPAPKDLREAIPKSQNPLESSGNLTFDTEASPFNKHKIFCASMTAFNDEKILWTNKTDGDKCIYELFKRLPKNKRSKENCFGKRKVIPYYCWVHFYKYDHCFIQKYLKGSENQIRNNGKIMTITGWIAGKKVVFRDSNRIITEKLEKFGKMFGLDQSKEVMPYRAYTAKTIKRSSMNIDKAAKLLKDPRDIPQFKKNLKDLDLILPGGTRFKHVEYAKYYCGVDTEVLAKGIIKFREMMKEVTDLDILNFISLPSISHQYFLQNGAYEGVYLMKGIVRDYIQKCVVGGRTQLRFNEKVDLRLNPKSLKMENNWGNKKYIVKMEDLVIDFEMPEELTQKTFKKIVKKLIRRKENITRDQIIKFVCDYYGWFSSKEIYDVVKKVRLIEGAEPINTDKEFEFPPKLDIKVMRDYAKYWITKNGKRDATKIRQDLREVYSDEYIEKMKELSEKVLKKVDRMAEIRKRGLTKIKLDKDGKIPQKVLDELIQDFDACSLYPSAMMRLGQLGGFLKGKPKHFINQKLTISKDVDNIIFGFAGMEKYMDYNELQKKDGYFIKIELKNDGKLRAFPILSKRQKMSRVWSNGVLKGIHYVDKLTLEDLVNFHELDPKKDFEIIDGYYFDEGRNNKILELIQNLYNSRLYHKGKHDKEGNKLPKDQWRKKNPIEQVYKLLMNSSYGRTILKPITDEYVTVDSKKAVDKMILNNHNRIKEFIPIEGTKRWLVRKIKTTEEHESLPQVGVEILSMSKRIMNEVMCLAEDIGIDLFYQDTDSMHVKNKDIKKLEKAYKEIYGRELIGGRMGQFHSDFDDIEIDGKKYKTLGSLRYIGLGKKAYYDKLVGWDEENQRVVYGDFFRMKGIKNEILRRRSKDFMSEIGELEDNSVEKVYDYMLTGEAVSFDLAEYPDIPCFEFSKDGIVSTKKKFVRRVKF